MPQKLFYYVANVVKHLFLANFLTVPIIFCLGGILLFNLDLTAQVFAFLNIGTTGTLSITNVEILALYGKLFPLAVVLGLLADVLKIDNTPTRLYVGNFVIHIIGLVGALIASSQLTGFNESWTIIVPIIAGLYFISFLSGSLYIFLNQAINRLIKFLQKASVQVQK